MQKIVIKQTGEIREVQNNEAHRLIEDGVAKLYTGVAPKQYKKKVMQPRKRKYGYHIK